jgi:hypothetical protein
MFFNNARAYFKLYLPQQRLQQIRAALARWVQPA